MRNNKKTIVFVERPPYNLNLDQYIDPDNIYEKILLLESGSETAGTQVFFDDVITTSLMNTNELAKVAKLLEQQYDIDVVLYTSESSIVPGAFMADQLGVAGIGYDVALKTRNKYLMSETLQAHNVRVPDYSLLTVGDDIEQAVEKLGEFPIICKPLMGFASQGVTKVDNIDQLRKAFHKIRIENKFLMRRYYGDDATIGHVLLQKFIPGTEYALDGYIQSGQVKLLAIADKPNVSNGPYFEDRMHILPARISHELNQAIETLAAQTVKSIGLDNSPFHIEMRFHDQQLYVIEVAARIGFIRCLQLLHNINACDLNFLLKKGELPKLSFTDKHVGSYCIVPKKRGRFKKITNLEELQADKHIAAFSLLASPNSLVMPPPNGNSYIGIVFALADRYDEVEQALNSVASNVKVMIS